MEINSYTLAENAGLNPISTTTELRNRFHTCAKWTYDMTLLFQARSRRKGLTWERAQTPTSWRKTLCSRSSCPPAPSPETVRSILSQRHAWLKVTALDLSIFRVLPQYDFKPCLQSCLFYCGANCQLTAWSPTTHPALFFAESHLTRNRESKTTSC